MNILWRIWRRMLRAWYLFIFFVIMVFVLIQEFWINGWRYLGDQE